MLTQKVHYYDFFLCIVHFLIIDFISFINEYFRYLPKEVYLSLCLLGFLLLTLMEQTMNNSIYFDNSDFSEQANMIKYLQSIKRYPLLSLNEEYELTKQYANTHDEKLANKLINSHLRLVVKVASAYKGYGLPMNEIIAEGNIGLLTAVKKFNPDKGFRFSTYSLWWIKAYIQKYILNSWSLVKIGTTSAQKRLFFNLRKIKNKLNLIDDRNMDDMTIDKIASSLSVSSTDVKEMNNRMTAQDTSLNTYINNDSDNGDEFIDFIVDGTINQEDKLINNQIYSYRKKLFYSALSCLNPREKDILFKRRLHSIPQTLDALSTTYNISKERVRQIELNSIKKIQKNIPLLQ